MITNIAAYVKRTAKITDALIRNPVTFRHFVKALGYAGASWKDLMGYDARGSVGTHKRINKHLAQEDRSFRIKYEKTRVCGKNIKLVTNNPGELLANVDNIRRSFESNGRSSALFMHYYELLCIQTFAHYVRQAFPDLAYLFKGQQAAQMELLALGSNYGATVRDNYLKAFSA